jgi:tripartite-type tricarboxylate transporter receptor subunit TctC
MRRCSSIVALGAALVISGSAFAQQYPSKPVKIIVPFPPAGVTDIVGRLVAQKLSEKLGEQFYVNQRRGWIASRFEQLGCSFLGGPGS